MKASVTLEPDDIQAILLEYFNRRGMRLDDMGYYRISNDRLRYDKEIKIVIKCSVEIIPTAEVRQDEL